MSQLPTDPKTTIQIDTSQPKKKPTISDESKIIGDPMARQEADDNIYRCKQFELSRALGVQIDLTCFWSS